MGGLPEDETGESLSFRGSKVEASLGGGLVTNKASWVNIDEVVSPVVARILLGTFGGASPCFTPPNNFSCPFGVFLASIEGMHTKESTSITVTLSSIFRRLIIFC